MAITYDVTTGLRALDGSNLISDIDAGLLSMAQDISNQRHALQAGVIDSGSYMAVQKAAGANMSVDVGSNSGRGMYVTDTSSRLVFVAPTGSATNVVVTANASGNPRIDIVTVSSAGVVAVTAGTATVGATLTNRTGAASVASGSQLIADILVANGAASITNSVIRDRRPWACGARGQVTSTSNAYNRTAATYALIDSTTLQPRVECSGVPLVVTFSCSLAQSTPAASNTAGFDLFIDGATASRIIAQPIAVAGAVVDYTWHVTPAAGSHLIGPAWRSDGTNEILLTAASANGPAVLTVYETVQAGGFNNAVTSG